jgi:hypothetical protein
MRFGAIDGGCAATSGSHSQLLRFPKQKLPANGYSNARKMTLRLVYQMWTVWRMAIGPPADQ